MPERCGEAVEYCLSSLDQFALSDLNMGRVFVIERSGCRGITPVEGAAHSVTTCLGIRIGRAVYRSSPPGFTRAFSHFCRNSFASQEPRI
jgi:hypothetical protein